MLNLDNRTEYLRYSLLFEGYLSALIASLLNITDEKNSRSLGFRSSAISFKTKVDILLDMNLINKDDIWKYETFMLIRNQFMHNMDADTYDDCLEYIDKEKKNKLLKFYPKNIDLSEEEKTKRASINLAAELTEISHKLFIKVMSKHSTDGNIYGNAQIGFSFKKGLEFLKEKLGDAYDTKKITLDELIQVLSEQLEKYRDEDNLFYVEATDEMLDKVKRTILHNNASV